MSINLYAMTFSSPCRAVIMTATHLNIDLNVITTDLTEGEHMTPEFIEMNPAHCVPTLDDNGFILWESRAIMQYLCNQYAPDSSLYPKDPKERAVVDRYLCFDMSLGTSQRDALGTKLFSGVDPPEDKLKSFKNNLKLLDQLIDDNKYLTGNEMTIADLSLLATIQIMELVKFDVTDYPNFKRWASSLKSELSYFDEVNDIDKEEIYAFVEKMKAKKAAQKDN